MINQLSTSTEVQLLFLKVLISMTTMEISKIQKYQRKNSTILGVFPSEMEDSDVDSQENRDALKKMDEQDQAILEHENQLKRKYQNQLTANSQIVLSSQDSDQEDAIGKIPPPKVTKKNSQNIQMSSQALQKKETGQSLPKRRMQQDRKNNLQSRKPKRVLKKPVFEKGNMRKLWSYHPVFKRPEGYTNADQLQQLSDREVASCDDLQLPTYADEVIRQLSPDAYQEISKILQVLRKDWRSLKPSSQAFLVARLADTNFMSDLTTIKCCCFGEYGNCFHEKNELPELSTCCLEMNQLCSAVHNEWKNVDFIVVDQDHVYEMLL